MKYLALLAIFFLTISSMFSLTPEQCGNTGVSCNFGQTCCRVSTQITKSGWKCYYVSNGVCCSSGDICCPQGNKCQVVGNQTICTTVKSFLEN